MANMTLEKNEGRAAGSYLHVIALVIVAVLLTVMAREICFSQGMPPRGDTTLRIDPLTKPPRSNVERLADEIINATDPRTGTISVRQLRRQTTTRPELQVEQNAVVTQYSTQTSTRPGIPTDQNASVTQTTTQPSTRPLLPAGSSSSVGPPAGGAPVRRLPPTNGAGAVRQTTGQGSTR